MTEDAGYDTDGVRWSGRLAVAGLAIAAVTAAVASLGPAPPAPVYWLGIAGALGGTAGVVVRSPGKRAGAGVLATIGGVLAIGYGVENGLGSVAGVGALLVLAGVAGVVADSRD